MVLPISEVKEIIPIILICANSFVIPALFLIRNFAIWFCFVDL